LRREPGATALPYRTLFGSEVGGAQRAEVLGRAADARDARRGVVGGRVVGRVRPADVDLRGGLRDRDRLRVGGAVVVAVAAVVGLDRTGAGLRPSDGEMPDG